MKKLIAIALLGATLGGCAELRVAGQAISLAEKSANNPVTKDDLAKAELAADAVVKALLVYKHGCERGAVDKNCRSNIAAIQQYTRQVPPYMAQLRSFVKQNDQINAGVVYNQLLTLIGNVKTTASNLGINLGV